MLWSETTRAGLRLGWTGVEVVHNVGEESKTDDLLAHYSPLIA